MEWIQLKEEKDIRKKILEKVDWEHSFIREISMISPSYILPDISVVAPDCLPSIRVFISSQSQNIPGLEILFVEAKRFSSSFDEELDPCINISNNHVEWFFLRTSKSPIQSKFFYYRLLNNETWGRKLRYSWEDLFDEGGELSIF